MRAREELPDEEDVYQELTQHLVETGISEDDIASQVQDLRAPAWEWHQQNGKQPPQTKRMLALEDDDAQRSLK